MSNYDAQQLIQQVFVDLNEILKLASFSFDGKSSLTTIAPSDFFSAVEVNATRIGVTSMNFVRTVEQLNTIIQTLKLRVITGDNVSKQNSIMMLETIHNQVTQANMHTIEVVLGNLVETINACSEFQSQSVLQIIDLNDGL